MSLETKDTQQISENWLLLSKEELIQDERVLEQYKNETNYNFLHTPKWNTAEGQTIRNCHGQLNQLQSSAMAAIFNRRAGSNIIGILY